MSKPNGMFQCEVGRDWETHRQEFSDFVIRVGDLTVMMEKVLEHTEHLKNIDSSMRDIKEGLLAPAIGKDHIPVKVHDMIVAQFARMARNTYLSMGSVIVALSIIIVFLLTGESSGWIRGLH